MGILQLFSVTTIGIVAIALSGCSAPRERLAAAGLFSPTGLRGEKHCETSNHCVFRTDESGLTHMSVGERSAVMIGFSGRGGDVRHYFDYLVTIQNIGETALVFDPNNIDGYDEKALLAPVTKRERGTAMLAVLTGLSMAMGNTHNVAALEDLRTSDAQKRTATESHFSEQKLNAQVIPPRGSDGGETHSEVSGKHSGKNSGVDSGWPGYPHCKF